MAAVQQKKYPFYFYLIALLIPVAFFLALEGVLRISGYGEEIPQWIAPSEKFSDYRMLNPDITRRYFHTLKKLPTPHFDAFRKQKRADTYRVFILGGSTAAGFPWPMNGAFSRYVKRYLAARYPDLDIEVVNLAIAAVNSYTLRDLMPGFIAQAPDLFLIYAGHNEYYGALGAGSSQFWGGSRALVNLLLDLRDIRTLQLLRDLIITARGWFAPAPAASDEATLMEGMVGEQLIPLHSDVYENGLRQFAGNMTDLLTMAKQAGIPVVISTMTANLKDQPPFGSAREDSLPPADSVYRDARTQLDRGRRTTAAAAFLRAKELDLLRFRAPEAVNRIIRDLAGTFGIPLVEMDSVFNRHARDSIVGNELMTDHVHPNISGIELLAGAFTSVMEQHHIGPANVQSSRTAAEARAIAARTGTMTRLDSAYGDLRLAYLKGGWPFRKSGGPNPTLRNFRPADRIEELALQLFREEVHWAEAHIRAALWYRDRGMIDQFERELLPLLEVIPYNDSPYTILIDGLIGNDRLGSALGYLQQMEKSIGSAYSAKWLGIWHLVNADYREAGRWLELSITRNDRDPQSWYNLAGVYIHRREYQQALAAVNRCLAIDPNFEGAARTRDDLESAVKQ